MACPPSNEYELDQLAPVVMIEVHINVVTVATSMKTGLSFSDSALLIFSTPHYSGYV